MRRLASPERSLAPQISAPVLEWPLAVQSSCLSRVQLKQQALLAAPIFPAAVLLPARLAAKAPAHRRAELPSAAPVRRADRFAHAPLASRLFLLLAPLV